MRLGNSTQKNGASPIGASFTNLLVRPLYEDIKRGTKEIRIVKDYGYIISDTPCVICTKELENQFRHAGWNYTCHICGVYITFDDVADYIKTIGKGSKNWEVIRENFKRYYHLKDRKRFLKADPKKGIGF